MNAKRSIITFSFFLLVALLSSVGQASAATPLRLQLSWVHQFQFAGYYMALEKGFYRAAGLDVEIRNVTQGGDSVPAVLSGTADFGIAGSGLLMEHSLGQPVVAVAAIFQRSPTIFLTLADSGIVEPADLVGRRVMMSPGFQSSSLLALLHQKKLEGRYERQETSYDYRSLLRGETDVFNAYSTNEPFQLEQDGVDYHVIDPNDYGINFYAEVLFTTAAMAQERPDDVTAFRDASVEGWTYALAHVDETIDLIINKYGVKKSRAALIGEAEAISRMIQPDKVAIGEQNVAHWAQITHYLIAIGAVDPEYHIDADFIFTPPERLNWQQLQPWILGFSVITLTLLAFVSVQGRINYRLSSVRKELEKEVADRQRAEAEVLKSKQVLEDALIAVSDGVWTWNVQTGEVHLDQQSRTIFGFADDEEIIASSRILQLVEPEDLPGVIAELDAHIDGKSDQYDHEFRVNLTDGSVCWVRGRGKILEYDPGGNPLRIVGTNADVTTGKIAEQKRQELEDQLHQIYKMEAIGTLAGGIAHDFNNALAIILGNLELSQLKLPPGNNVSNYLDQAKTASLRARDLVQQILVYSRQGQRYELKPINIYRVVSESLKLLRATIPTTVELQIDIDDNNRELSVAANSTQVQQVLINLCNNAVHALDGKGMIQVQLRSISLEQGDLPSGRSLKSGNYLQLRVEDSGCGMNADLLEKIFDPFFTTKEVGAGTGLGLAVVQGIVDSHNGFIEVSSQLGQGTVFRVYLPQIAGEEIIPVEDERLPTGQERILLVDDEALLVDIGEQILSRHGYQVVAQTDSVKALELFQQQPDQFDLLITDQTMPGLDGVELITRVHEIRSALPVILCTGYSARITEEEAMAMGIDAFCTKPFNMAQLLQKTRAVLDQKSG